MNQSASNPLERELARAQQAGPHPDPGILTAFAEGSLLKHERNDVMAHLATCAECRQVMSLSAAAAPDVFEELVAAASPQPATPPAPRKWIPWATIAAAICVVCAVGVSYQLNHRTGPLVAVTVPQPPVSEQPKPSESTAPTATPATPEKRIEDRKAAARPATGTGSKLTLPEDKVVVNAGKNAAYETNNNEAAAGAIGGPAGATQSNYAGGIPSPGVKQPPPPSAAQPAPAPLPSNNAAISGRMPSQLASIQSESAQAQVTPDLKAERKQGTSTGTVHSFAQAAPARAMSSAAFKAVPRPQWRINDAGQVERSFDQRTWQPVLLSESTPKEASPREQSKMRVVSVIDGEVWVGGDHGRLYHSIDNGITWTPVTLPAKGGGERVIAHIQFQTTQIGVVTAEDGTAWSTTDGGHTWN